MANMFMTMLDALKIQFNKTVTENGAVTLKTTGSSVLDLFATIGALRNAGTDEIIRRFERAWSEDRDIAIKLLFYARDVRGGLGERKVFRVILSWMAENEPESVRKNIPFIAEYGRYDDLTVLINTPCEKAVLKYIGDTLRDDLQAMEQKRPVSLLAKWLPSVNASNKETVMLAKRIAAGIGMKEAQYRKTLSALRKEIRILENYLREKNYSFSYQEQPSNAMFKYRRAFIRNDPGRYLTYMNRVAAGETELHTGNLMPYELIRQVRKCNSESLRKSLDITWKALEDYTDGRNALAVIDGSGSMYWGGDPTPGDVALSLGLYFAERNTGAFYNHFITFSESPRLISIHGKDLADKVRYCASFNECANTNIQKVFELILNSALEYNLPQKELPETLYFISDMEFDSCTRDATLSNFEYAKRQFEAHGYRLPQVVFWNVQSRNSQQPVEKNEQGAALVSGCSPKIFSMVMENELNPESYMMKVLYSKRYEKIRA